jgi:hypothetical protein
MIAGCDCARRSGIARPFRYTLPAAVLGFIVGWAGGVWLGWEPCSTGVGILLLAQVIVDAS